jgi:hypothetical protein
MTSHPQQAHRRLRTIEPTGGFQRTPEWHRARARFLWWLNEPEARRLALNHEALARLIERRRRQARNVAGTGC